MNELSKIIRTLIEKSGPITFAEFMELALYHKEFGYYTSGTANLGKKGDYYTSPHVHCSFGEVIARFSTSVYEKLTNSDFTIIEFGSGNGLLALDILNSIKTHNTDCYKRLKYILIERSPESQQLSKQTLREHKGKARWISSVRELKKEGITGLIISNELVDSFPFHRVKVKNGKLLEIFVSFNAEGFYEILGKPSTDHLTSYFKNVNLKLDEGQEAEINLKAKNWFNEINYFLSKGIILTIDYGYLNKELYKSSRHNGTFLCFYKNTINENPYTNIGEQDITAHVDFSYLMEVGQSKGLNTLKYTTQGQFLIDWGILDIYERYTTTEKISDKNLITSTMAIKNLFLPTHMGDKFKVLIQEKKSFK